MYTCTCPDYKWDHLCKHVHAVHRIKKKADQNEWMELERLLSENRVEVTPPPFQLESLKARSGNEAAFNQRSRLRGNFHANRSNCMCYLGKIAKIQDSMTELERLVQPPTVGPSLPYVEELMAFAVSVAKATQAAESQADPQPFPGKEVVAPGTKFQLQHHFPERQKSKRKGGQKPSNLTKQLCYAQIYS